MLFTGNASRRAPSLRSAPAEGRWSDAGSAIVDVVARAVHRAAVGPGRAGGAGFGAALVRAPVGAAALGAALVIALLHADARDADADRRCGNREGAEREHGDGEELADLMGGHAGHFHLLSCSKVALAVWDEPGGRHRVRRGIRGEADRALT